MARRLTLTFLAAFTLVLFTAIPARADWLLTPYLGVTFGGDTGGQHVTYGGSFGWMGAGIIGFEVDGAFAPDVFDTDDGVDLSIKDSNATTLMANLIVGAPIGGQAGVRPYVSGGAGLLRSRVQDVDQFFDVDDNSFGVNIGGGVMAFVRQNFGIRGDIRYFRGLQDVNVDRSGASLNLGTFDFWRGTFGVTFRF
ncbi:MAG TPA: outer membrane beta-barrel protein [Vicinamibacterales bacterium]|jgi:opacity protein-like surface antigen|nr:outer membrane beta-barrel protein [Vicinamibacterales bacterium]